MSIVSSNLKVREIIHQVVNDPEYRNVSYVPLISYHQLALILLAYTGVFGSIALHIFSGINIVIFYPLMMLSFYTAFTPLHDATHKAVSSNKLINDFLGTLSGFLIFPVSNAIGYRYLHMAHHRYVGDKDLDPDEPMVTIPTKYFPLGYIVLLFPDFIWVHWLLFKAWKRTPVKTRINVLVMIGGNVIFHIAWFLSPFWYEYLVLFFIPNRLGITYTAFTFAHSPHPEGLKWNDFPFDTTFILKGKSLFLKTLFGQEHHAMHHFLPHIPWYKYFKVWDLANGVFKKQSIPEKYVFSKPDIHHKDKLIQKRNELEKPILKVRIASINKVASNVKSFSFISATNEVLPEFTAGSHIDVYLPSGLKRSYSIINPPFEKDNYQIAVKLELNGKGGSREMHEQISEGDIIEISHPKNNFVLYENAKKYILISGGIGITPLISMAQKLTELDKYFEFHICSKNKEDIPFQYELSNWTFAPNIEIHLDKHGKSSMDIDKVLSDPEGNTLIYVCGPAGFNRWIRQTAKEKGWSREQIKEELFSNETEGIRGSKEFELVLHKSKKSITVKKDETIIDALHLNNIKVDYTCLQGTCGTCLTKVIDGKIDHRDAVLSEEEKNTNKIMCLCVSRAKDNKLVIDL
ncbi:MAG: 2Fe-2S iron-sulfur cluster binding domain-containing protein [Saprospiraceae bacterium]|nr:2Fe-2S iron-sulfur cluster binding domain-containing protein [Saprospiraceae bacterium]